MIVSQAQITVAVGAPALSCPIRCAVGTLIASSPDVCDVPRDRVKVYRLDFGRCNPDGTPDSEMVSLHLPRGYVFGLTELQRIRAYQQRWEAQGWKLWGCWDTDAQGEADDEF
jgi:hypothetical protein